MPSRSTALREARAERAPVVIVGAGPVGMALALELARAETGSVVVERKPHLERVGSRSIVIAAHTIQTFDRLGCGAAIAEKGVALRRARTYFRDRELFTVTFPPAAAGEIPRFMNLQQTYTEAALLAAIERSANTEVLWGTEVTALSQDDSEVRLEMHGRGGRRTIRAPFVVACDGAHSTIRETLRIPFQGRSFRDRFLIADIRAELPFAHERRFYFDPPFNPGRQVLIHPQPDSEWRIDWQVRSDTDAEAERTGGRLDRRIREVVGDAAYELTWLTAYRFHERVAARLRVGRVMLAGDAAHLFAPFGARGMNSGVEDARNLGWKLAMVLGGGAPPTLLGSYERERLQAARENLRVTSKTMRFMAPPSPAHRLLRNAILRGSLRVAPLRRYVNSGKLAEPAIYGSEADLVGRLAPEERGEERPAGRGFTVARAADRWIVIRPDGYVCAELGATAPDVLEGAIAQELGGGDSV